MIHVLVICFLTLFGGLLIENEINKMLLKNKKRHR